MLIFDYKKVFFFYTMRIVRKSCVSKLKLLLKGFSPRIIFNFIFTYKTSTGCKVCSNVPSVGLMHKFIHLPYYVKCFICAITHPNCLYN
uniref:Uncharacterized protein n=1 Tax=Rhipicephalus zambeziensis TaxID=60191 RepID=A0A224YH37_9ACAR